MQQLRDHITKLARSQAPVYIHGESGSGKELVARAIHNQSGRAKAPFVAVNCGAIPRELMESEFFGHKKGSFTGATADKIGLFQSAHTGTLFLDEVADLPLDMQVKLLRAIQEKCVRPVGSEKEVHVDARILSATHKDLQQEVLSNRFRQDLFFRINVIQTEVPSLRERPEDIPVLIHHFLQQFNKDKVAPIVLDPSAQQALLEYPFPGNVRELENILERACTLCENHMIHLTDMNLPTVHLPATITVNTAPPIPDATVISTPSSSRLPIGGAFSPKPVHPAFNNFDQYIEDIERAVLEQALTEAKQMNPQQKLLILDTWQRSGLPGSDFSSMVGVSKHTLYSWKQRFDQYGPEGLVNKPKGGPKGSRLLEVTKRTILMIKRSNPDYGCERISAMLTRGPALQASASAVATVLKEAGYVTEEEPTRPHPDKVRHFERARPNQMWQTDLFTFMLKRQNRRVFLIVYLDDHSRFIVGYGLHASASTELAIEVFRSGVASYGAPEEVLTDNGPQYHTWRGKSRFTKTMEQLGVKQIVAKPRHPQTLGKTERFWGTLWRELLDRSIFLDMGDAKIRIGHFIDHYNFQRPHQGIDNLVPADRFFQAAPEVLKTLKARVAANALELSQGGVPKQPFYMTGQVGGQAVGLHAEGERMILTSQAGVRREVDLTAPVQPVVAPTPAPVCPDGSPPGAVLPEQPPPGVSVLDAGIRQMHAQVPANKETGHAEDQAR
jgi:DNA-binding NtrC family response regulator/transposase InsO family protein